MKLNNSELINLWQFSLGDKEKEILGDILFTERIDINDNKITSIPRKIIKIRRSNFYEENEKNNNNI
jgi:hypothetical protein